MKLYRINTIEWFEEHSYFDDIYFWRSKADYEEYQYDTQTDDGTLQETNTHYMSKRQFLEAQNKVINSNKLNKIFQGQHVKWAFIELSKEKEPEYFL